MYAANKEPGGKSTALSVMTERLGWGGRLGLVLFFMMLFVPTHYQMIKAVILAMVLGMIVIEALIRGRIRLHPAIPSITLLVVIVGLIGLLRGVLNNAPGVPRVGTIYVLWPIVYTLLVAGAAHENVLNNLVRVLVFATIAIGLFGLSYVLFAAGWLPEYLYFPIDQGQRIGFLGGYIEFNLESLSSLLFLVPFVTAALVIWPKDEKMPVSRIWLWVAFLLGMALVLLSGRRGLLLVVALSPIFIIALRTFLPKSAKSASRKALIRIFAAFAIMLGSLTIIIQQFYDFRPSAVMEMFMEGFNFGASYSSYVRQKQFDALIGEWEKSPLLGAGHGASAPGIIRDPEMPWAYELSYVALLFHTGLVGVLVYVGAVAWIFWMGIRLIRSGAYLGRLIFPVLIGMACFLLANGTNPYLEKYDYIWVIFLPILITNYGLIRYSSLRISRSLQGLQPNA